MSITFVEHARAWRSLDKSLSISNLLINYELFNAFNENVNHSKPTLNFLLAPCHSQSSTECLVEMNFSWDPSKEPTSDGDSRAFQSIIQFYLHLKIQLERIICHGHISESDLCKIPSLVMFSCKIFRRSRAQVFDKSLSISSLLINYELFNAFKENVNHA